MKAKQTNNQIKKGVGLLVESHGNVRKIYMCGCGHREPHLGKQEHITWACEGKIKAADVIIILLLCSAALIASQLFAQL